MEVAEFRGHVQTRLRDFSLDVEFDTHGGTLALVGPNGAGKTSFLEALIGALDVDCGWISLGARQLLDTSARVSVPLEQRRLGYLPQSYALFPHLSVSQNVEFPMLGRIGRRAVRRERVQELLRQLDVAHVATQGASSLSGGEMQRVALARALASEPAALLLDEPLAAMDVSHRRETRAFLSRHLSALSLPTILITHDAIEARALADRVLVLEAGKVTQAGSFEDLERKPATRFVAQFVGSSTA